MISRDRLFREMTQTCYAAGLQEFRVAMSPEVTKEHKSNRRRYAQMYFDRGIPVFEFAEQTRELPYCYRLGLYAHEIGHALHPGTEEDADAAGMRALGLLILYDHSWPGKGLQTAVW